ncbi:MAG: hypothetical protein JWR67_1941 [Mucilaginibacter sp.]|nr:hypothetical protein [Mucilaginibacter sp.]MDB5110827.1 hypothetical protein [Mucilaginibacter sp.]
MKKVICMIALAAISYGTVYAALPMQTQTDTTKMKTKKKTTKMKKKMKKDTTKM